MLQNFDRNLGYYTVGEKEFGSKIQALIYGTQHNIHPEWQFDNKVWHSQDWTIEPNVDLLTLYKIRAKQIREKYDYVIINYSGGSDSQTVVDAFLQAGCFIDEIVTIWNRKYTKKIVLDPSMQDSRNIEAEFDLTTKQGINNIINKSPNTKITYRDISDDLVDSISSLDAEEWVNYAVEHLNPGCLARWSVATRNDQRRLLDAGKRVAVVYGIDKPRVCIKDGNYCAYFVDSVPNATRTFLDAYEYNNVEKVYFYWAAELPDIVIKQAHVVKKWFECNAKLRPILHWPNHDFSKKQAYEIILRTLIYPEWDMTKFQCMKADTMVFNQWDQWFFTQYKNTSLFESWYKGVNYVEKNIDPKFLRYDIDGNFTGFVGMINGHFCLD
jgi:hypothetical protein